jgi:hypothetical protein
MKILFGQKWIKEYFQENTSTMMEMKKKKNESNSDSNRGLQKIEVRHIN